MASVRSTSFSSEEGEKSLEYEVALRAPAKTRSPSDFDAASFKLSGFRTEWTARLPSALAILAVALASVTRGRRALGTTGSLLAALIWLVNAGNMEKGRLIEIEAIYVSLTALAFIFWMAAYREEKTGAQLWLSPAIFLGLGMLAKGPLPGEAR